MDIWLVLPRTGLNMYHIGILHHISWFDDIE